MKKVAFITGSSKGIGNAITELLLRENYIVFGYSRTNTIKHQNFSFTEINLCDLKEIQKIYFPAFNNAEVILINNAATIGEITPLNRKHEEDIINEYNLNIVSPTILCARFINSFQENKKMIINISSGASNSAIASWSTYCATKSALDRLTDVIAAEKHSNLNIFSVHPGVVDTQMQLEIRKTKPELFPLSSKFHNYYNNNELENTKVVAQKILHIIKNTNQYHQNILSIRDVNIN